MPKPHERGWYQGTVREVRPGVWRAERPRVKGATGRSTRPSRTFRGEGAARGAAAWARGDPEPAVVVLGDFLNRWLGRVEPTVSANTFDKYRRDVLACKPLAGRPLAEVTPDEWQQLANALLGRWSRYHVHIWKGNISVALRTAIPRHRPDNPIIGVKLPKQQEEPPKAWTQAEVDRLLAAAVGKAHEPWLLFSLGTGVRLGEARALLWRDVDLAAKTATIRASLDNNTSERGPTKTRRLRVIDVPDEVCLVLAELRKRQPPKQAFVFGYTPKRGRERAYRPRSYRSWLATRCAEAGVTDLPPVALRHTCASLALARRVPVADVAKQLGHTVETCTRTYAHYINEGLRVMATALGGALTNRLSGAPRELGAGMAPGSRSR
jgi:integrase